MDLTAIERLDGNLFVARRPLRLAVGDLGARMTIVRLAGDELWLHSPVPLDAATRSALDELGPVRWIFGPNNVHHFALREYVEAFPEAALCGAPGLPKKQPELKFQHLLSPGTPPPWGEEIQIQLVEGAPRLDEIVCFHPATRTLVFTDLAFNVDPARRKARLFHWLVGANARFGPHRLVRSMIRDPAAAHRSIDAVLQWDFDRVIVSHGEVLETGGRRAVEEAFRFLEC